MGANVQALNNADQTFLHLINLSDISSTRDLPLLLGALVKRGFNFGQQDHNGQTALHSVTQHLAPWKILSGILQGFQFHGIELPVCRNNQGHTVAEQLREQGFKLQWPYDEYASLTTTAGLILSAHQHSALTSNSADYQIINPDRVPSASHDVLQEYEKHAELLRTIVRAGNDPSFEDSEGRNGLHCLAEVRLDLPTSLRKVDSEPCSVPTKSSSSAWEQYMDQLLTAGVNPNRYDRNGHTPFMAFAHHWRGKDEDLTTRLLERLVTGGANIHRRNQLGETALHIAVKLGHRAATKVLLSHGANIHARTCTGQGILSLGIKHSNLAINDEILYAQISLCVCLVANAGGISTPTILHEWASPDFRVLPDQQAQAQDKVTKSKETDRPTTPVILQIFTKW
ncbi:hypothetical protein EG329_009134 [Mollisiaceae sp. DMI_Dod_QoI]|nr:hypothetical protein EG329_009134 [Helotiales sp. DMI_Dod_QoI]